MTEKVVFHTLKEIKNKYFPNRSLEELEAPEKEKPFLWGDEIESPKEVAEKDDNGQSYTSVEELLEDEEKERLGECLRKHPASEIKNIG